MLSKQSKFDLRNDRTFFLNCKKKHSPYFSFFYTENKSEPFEIDKYQIQYEHTQHDTNNA